MKEYPNYTVAERKLVRSAILTATERAPKEWFDSAAIYEMVEPSIKKLHSPLWEAVSTELEYLVRQGLFEKSRFVSMGPGYDEYETLQHNTPVYRRKDNSYETRMRRVLYGVG